MALTRNKTYDIDMSVTGQQNPVGGYIKALQQGKVGKVSGTMAIGFDANAIGAGALNFATVSTTTSSSAGTITTVTYTVPDSPASFTGHVLVQGNGYLDVTSSSPGYSYSSGTLTISVGSAAASQTLTVLILNN